VKTVQSLMRDANSNITMNIYTHAVTSKKRRAQQKVVEMILPEGRSTAAYPRNGTLSYPKSSSCRVTSIVCRQRRV
jgi:hypothetical protein